MVQYNRIMGKVVKPEKRVIVAYEGEKFTIEWYYNESGKSPALNYFNGLSEDEKDDALGLFKLMGDKGKIFNKTKFMYEGDKIYAFKPQPHRFLNFFMKGGKIILTNAFEKRQDKLPRAEKNRALGIMDDYLNKVMQGTYYEEGEN